MQFLVSGTVQTGIEALDTGITDLDILQVGSTMTVIATSGANGGLSTYSVPLSTVASVVDTKLFNPSWAIGISNEVIVASDGASLRAVIGATGSTRLGSYTVTAGGTIGSFLSLNGLSANFGEPTSMDVTSDSTLVLGSAGGGFSVFDLDSGVLTNPIAVADTDVALIQNVSASTNLHIGTSDILIVGSSVEHGITSFRMTSAGPVLTDRSGPDEGVGLMIPTDMATAQVQGDSYVLVASAQDLSGALSVFRVGADGSLEAVDHVLDTLYTRFGGVQSIETVQTGGVTYVIAGGADDGLSLFVLLPGGQLQYLTSIEDGNGFGLSNVSDIAAGVLADQIRVLVASASETGLTDLSVDLGVQGLQVVTSENGQTLGGTDDRDILIGGAGVDRLSGGLGDDIIVDGAARDVLTGNGGRDIFVLRDDGTEDIITDFEPAFDRLDLSSWMMFHDPESLTITSTYAGAEVLWKTEKLMIRSAAGGSLDPDVVRAAVLLGIDRPIDLTTFVFPNDGAFDLTGTDGDDIIRGDARGETIIPGLGNDTVWAGDGDDDINGLIDIQSLMPDAASNAALSNEPNDNCIYAGAGNDLVRTGGGADMIDGGTGDDRVFSGDGDDQILGGDGADRIVSDAGNDSVFGGLGNDKIFGRDGNDTLNGELGDDRIFGDLGDDFITGGDGNDLLVGWYGDDVIDGGAGDDALIGQLGLDHLIGGDGADLLFGHRDEDRLEGGAGADQLFGGADNDVLIGDGGNDKIFGGPGRDSLFGGDDDDILGGRNGNDYIEGGEGNDKIFGDDQNDTLLGDGGIDLIYGGTGDDVIHGGAGDDELLGQIGNDVLYGDDGDDLMHGHLGDDTLYGGSGNDRVLGDAGDDILDGSSGNDILGGGTGADLFIFDTAVSGMDRIVDFETNVDLIRIIGATLNQLSVVETANGTQVLWDDGGVLFQNLSPSDFSLLDFEYA